jgi:hypothetical protein
MKKKDEYEFTEKEINNITALCKVLRKVHERMIQEGYHVINRKIVSIETGEIWENPKGMS